MMSRQVGGDKGLFLRASRDIEHVKQHGRRISTTLFNMLICRTDAMSGRVGIIVGKRFGTAVRRNRAKRRFRELARLVQWDLAAGSSLLVFPKRDAMDLPFEALIQVWRSTLKRQGVLRPHEH